MSGQVIKVSCKCGYLLFKYFKHKRGKLIKLFLDEIREDNVVVSGLANGARPVCPNCQSELGVVGLVKGRPAIKVNHGTIRLRT
ncbi:MAG: hypothetical protein US96_C0056G0002 [Candidatus Woesebacteria bacterium GW2011_GWB1_38_5b]|uniref:Uncharacterized protein n=1 Tax=Candidatus Woesebacteria bacterium GW2011_GWB1_38_5b TaxID=1618569 RepID=A0A0G0N9A6_9BACT|nr:MAG: hypothetical protein US96_C0056G0002 [Candidatus Woesebacteria bacterium GW2011_GWB1_38_5b]